MEASERGVFYKLGKWCLMALVFLLPIWVLPTTIFPVEFNKALLVSVFVFFALIGYIAESIRTGQVALPWHWLFLALVVLMVSWLASALISGTSEALWGGHIAYTSFFDVLTLTLFAVLVAIFFQDEHSLKKLVKLFIAGLAAFVVMVCVFSIFDTGGYWSRFFGSRVFNTVGSWNSVAVASGLLAVMLYPFLLKLRGFKLVLTSAIFFIALLLLVFVNFLIPAVIVGFFGIMLVSYDIWRRNISFKSFLFPMVLILAGIIVFIFQGFIAESVVFSLASFLAPAEVSVSHGTTLNIVSEALRENLMFGSGPTSFGYLWDKFKPLSVNNTIFWNLRFNIGSSYFLTILAETGFLAALAFGILLAVSWYRSLAVFAGADSQEGAGPLAFVVFLFFSYAILTWSLYAAGYTLTVFGFLALGFSLAQFVISGKVKMREFQLFSEGPKGFVSAILVVIFVIFGIAGIYASAARYFGQANFAQGVDAFNRLNNMEIAEKNILLALKADKNNDLYLRTLSELYTVRARLFLGDSSAPRELLGSKFKEVLDLAVAAAQRAISAAPRDFNNYRTLGKIYELLAQLNTGGAAEAAAGQYGEAQKLSPKNPLLWRDLAAVYLAEFSASGNRELLQKSEEALMKAVELKPDYTEAHFLLAQIYESQGKSKEAIARGESAALLAPNDIGTLFQLGLLYYRAGRLRDAEAVFSRAVAINENYSNARYFLGLIYGRTNRSAEAISEFEKILRLNPENDEVIKILSNLRSGRGILEGVQGFEQRSEPPIRGDGNGLPGRGR